MIKYSDSVASALDGRPVYGAQVSTYVDGGGLAPIYADASGTTPLTQPILTNQMGYFEFYIGDGVFDISVMTGDTEIDRQNITIVDGLALKSRSILVPVNETGAVLPAAANRLGGVLGFDASTGAPTVFASGDFVGPPGPAMNSYNTANALAASPTSNLTAQLGGKLFVWTLGDFTGQEDGVYIIASTGTPISTGAWIASSEGIRRASGLSKLAKLWGFDDFDRGNQTLTTTLDPQGRTYLATGTGASTVAIINKMVYEPTNKNFYVSTSYTSQISDETFQFMFVETGISSPTKTGARQATLIVQASDNTLSNMQAHAQFGMGGFTCDTRLAGVWNFSALSGAYRCEPNTWYTARIIINGTTLTVVDPFGRRYTTAVAGNASIVGTIRTFQIFDAGASDTYEYDTRIGQLAVGDEIPSRTALMSGAPPNETAAWRGLGMTSRAFGPTFTASANGSYRIARQTTYPGGFAIIGLFEIYAQAVNGTFDHIVVSVNCRVGATPTIQQVSRQSNGSPLSLITASQDGTGNCALDLTFPSAATSAVTVQWRSLGAVADIVAVPVIASPYGTAFPFAPQSPAEPPVVGTVSAAGTYAVEFGAAFGGFAMMSKFTVTAVSAIAASRLEFYASGDPTTELVLKPIAAISKVAKNITAVTISRNSADTGSTGIRLDITTTLPAGFPIDIKVEKDGIALPVASLSTVGSPLATQNKVWTVTDDADRIASATYDPPSLANGTGATTTISCPGAVPAQSRISAIFSNDLQGIILFAWPSASGTASVRFQNGTGSTIDLASGTLKVEAIPQL